jgi:hypothetical protein
MIMSDQITREDALQEMKTNSYPQSMVEEDKSLVLKKLGMSESEWDKIMDAPVHSHDEYPTSDWITKLLTIGHNTLRSLGHLK